MPKPSKKHHFVPQAQLRHFASDAERRSIWVYDKVRERSWLSSLLNAGSENDFNTVELETGKWNFEDLFQDVDGRSAALISEIVSRRTLSWITYEDREAINDLFATQTLRTKLSRTTPHALVEQMRAVIRNLGYDPDDDPTMAMPTEAALRIGTVKAFLRRDDRMASMRRLVPVLFTSGDGQRFIISDDPVVLRNAFPYGDDSLGAHGIIAFLPIARDLALALMCPTIISRYEAVEDADIDPELRAKMLRYRDGMRKGEAIAIDPTELNSWNLEQVSGSSEQLYAAADSDFDAARELLMRAPKLKNVLSRMSLGEMGQAPPPRRGMPDGLQLVIQGKYDHAILPIIELDEEGEGLTARTTAIELLRMVEADENELRTELYEDGQFRQGVGQAMVERFGEPSAGWFRVVHKDTGLRAFAREIDQKRR